MLVDLSKTPFAEVLQRLSAGRRSGDLVVRHEHVVKTVFFDRGRLVFAASNLEKDRLGEAMVALGRITHEELQRASQLMRPQDRGKRFGEALVEAGVMDRGEIGTAVARQVRRIAVSLFALPGGAASFDDRPCVIPVEYMVALSLHQVLYAGIKSMTDERLLLAGLGDRGRQVRLARMPPFKFPLQRCSELEREILERARRPLALDQLVSAGGALSFPRLRAVYALVASGVLEQPGNGAQAEPIVQTDAGSFLMSALQREPEPSMREALRREVQQELARSARLDVEGWLASAQSEEVARAVEQKMERFNAMHESVADDLPLRTNIELILGRAYTVLRRVRARRAPAAPASQPQAGKAPAGAPAAPADRGPERGGEATAAPAAHKADAPPASVQQAAVASAAPEAMPPPGQSTLAPAADAPMEAPAVGATQPPATPAAAAAPAGPSLDAERALMEGDVRMTISDYASAVECYDRLVELAPNVPAYRLKLAIAMACWPRTAKQAERQFLEALRMKPNDAHFHFQFGLYYRAMKQRARALTEMRTALSLDPRHAGARREIESLSPRDTALASFKKLFR